MAVPQGILRYNGIACDGRWSYFMAPGRTPSVINANFILGASIPYYGTITLEWNGQSVSMADCHTKRLVITNAGTGRYQSCLIEDFRWRWQYIGKLYGNYNTFQKGVFQKDSKMKLSQLVGICLASMGVSANTSGLPELYPLVDWAGEPAAVELQRLLDLVGYDIVPRWGNQVELVEVGVGRGISFDTRMMETTASKEPPVIPETLYVDSTATLWQEDIILEPIGFEKNSTEPKHIDELSYKDGDWEGHNRDPYNWHHITNIEDRKLACKWVYRAWRIKGPIELTKIGGGKFTVPSDEMWRILPMNNGQLELYKASSSDEVKPAQLVGFFSNKAEGHKNNVDQTTYTSGIIDGVEFEEGSDLESAYPEYIYKGSFTVDVQRGLVFTTHPVFFMERSNDNKAVEGRWLPLLKLRIAFVVRDKETRHKLRKDFEYHPPNGVSGTEIVISPEKLVYEQGREQHTDDDKFDDEALGFAKKELRKYTDGLGYSIPMKGLALDIELDGRYRSIRYQGGGGQGATTVVEWGMEVGDLGLSYAQKLRELEIRDAIKNIANVKKEHRHNGTSEIVQG